jgi:hypothetical protein
MTNLNSITPQDSLYCSPVNNTGLDPLQGFDFHVWVQDVCTGKVAWFGLFQSLTLSIRDATETYLELGQRIPIHLNGEIQVAWVLEQGLVDMQFIQRTFGVDQLRRDMYITRGPRFQISFDAYAGELETFHQLNAPGKMDRDQATGYRQGSDEYFTFNLDQYAGYGQDGKPGGEGGRFGATAQGRYDILRAKVDSVSLGIMPGRRVAAVRWEGVSEGIAFVRESIQKFKKAPNRPTGASQGGFVTNLPSGGSPPTTTGPFAFT